MSDYLRRLGFTIAGCLLLALALVIAADPYGLYGFGPALKPRPDRYQSEIKLTIAMRRGSDALILGNSRADIGFDPAHAVFAAGNLNAYNLAVPGSSTADGARQLAHLLRNGHRPKVLIVGAEFLDFLTAPDAPATVPELRRHPIDDWRWRANALFSMASVGDAWRTLRMQNDPYAEAMTERGFNPLREYDKLGRQEGYHALFAQRAQENAKAFARKPRALRSQSGSSGDIEALRALLRAAAAAGIEVHIVIYPYHAQIMRMFEDFGLSALFDEWKTILVDEARQADPALIRVWDFSGYGGPRCEKIPAKGDRTAQTEWYWEGGHFKRALGDGMLEQILTDRAGIGFRLDQASLAANRKRLVQERKQCSEAYPELFAAGATPLQ